MFQLCKSFPDKEGLVAQSRPTAFFPTVAELKAYFPDVVFA